MSRRRWVDEKGIDKATYKATYKVLVEVDPKYLRLEEVEQLLGNPRKAKTNFGWNPTSTSFEELGDIVVNSDVKFVERR